MNLEFAKFKHYFALTSESNTGNFYVLGHYLLAIQQRDILCKEARYLDYGILWSDNLVEIYWYPGDACWLFYNEGGGTIFLQNGGKVLWDYKKSYQRIWYSLITSVGNSNLPFFFILINELINWSMQLALKNLELTFLTLESRHFSTLINFYICSCHIRKTVHVLE